MKQSREPHRILVVSPRPEVLASVAKASQPKGWQIFQADSLSELTTRVEELKPRLLVLDTDHKSFGDVGGMVEMLQQTQLMAERPLLLLVAETAAAITQHLAASLTIDGIIEPRADSLDLAIEVRSLLRVRHLAAKTLRERDVLHQLFELSTVSSEEDGVDETLQALVGQLARWLGMPHMVLSLGGPQRPTVAARYDSEATNRGRSLIETFHERLSLSGEGVTLGSHQAGESGLDTDSLPYVGLPLQGSSGHVLGVLHAWGARALPDGNQMRVLQAAATRIGSELQLRDSHRQLENMVEARTSDLTALLDRVRAVNSQLVEASRDTIMRLARAAEYRDGDTGEHVERMSSYAQLIAKQMGMSEEEQALIKLAAPMHDIGKIGIPDSILLKEGKLTPDEYDVMKQHPLIGARILTGSRNKLLMMAEVIAATHHERWDGTGYPKGLSGTEIPLVGRIVALADVFDALASPRVYKHAWSIEETISYIQGLSGMHFDPSVVEAFEQCLDSLLKVRSQLSDTTAHVPAELSAS